MIGNEALQSPNPVQVVGSDSPVLSVLNEALEWELSLQESNMLRELRLVHLQCPCEL